MKKIIKTLAVAILLISLLPSCKKSDSGWQQLTTLQKIQAKWQVQTYYENDHYFGADHIKNSTGTANDYLDFRTDGKLYTSMFGYKDTVAYSLPDDAHLLIGSSSKYEIKTLTANSMVLYGMDISGADFLEENITLSK